MSWAWRSRRPSPAGPGSRRAGPRPAPRSPPSPTGASADYPALLVQLRTQLVGAVRAGDLVVDPGGAVRQRDDRQVADPAAAERRAHRLGPGRGERADQPVRTDGCRWPGRSSPPSSARRWRGRRTSASIVSPVASTALTRTPRASHSPGRPASAVPRQVQLTPSGLVAYSVVIRSASSQRCSGCTEAHRCQRLAVVQQHRVLDPGGRRCPAARSSAPRWSAPPGWPPRPGRPASAWCPGWRS